MDTTIEVNVESTKLFLATHFVSTSKNYENVTAISCCFQSEKSEI